MQLNANIYNNIPSQFDQLLDKDERIVWTGKPAKLIPFLATGLPFLLLGTAWFCFDYFVVIKHISKKSGMDNFMIPFFIAHLAPFWLSVLNIVRLGILYKKNNYAYTNKRLMLQDGFLGNNFKAIDFDKIKEIEVKVNPIENIYKIGTLRFDTGIRSSKGAISYTKFMTIEFPYEVFKNIKQISSDFKNTK